MVKVEGSSFAEPAADYKRAHSDESTSRALADSHPNMSIGIGASKPLIQQHLSCSPPQMGGQFVPPRPAAQHKSSWTQHGMADNYSIGGSYDGQGSHHRMGGNGAGPQQSDSNSPNNLNASAASGQSRGHSSMSTEEMQKQMKVKDKVITELAGIVESLEIDYGISIDDQTQSFQNFVNIAHSMKEEAREAGNAASSGMTKGKYPP